MWGPGDGFDSCGMGTECIERFIIRAVPDDELVIVSARCELAFFRIPAEAADFLFVGAEFAEVVVWDADIAM